MAIGTTAALLIGAGIAGGAQAYGAHKQASASKEATKAQTASNDAALAYAKEQEAIRRADYERAYAEWQAGRQALMSRYGISVPSVPSRSAPPMAGGASLSGVTPQQAQTGALIPRAQNLAGVVAANAMPSETYDRWNDWRSYGLPSA